MLAIPSANAATITYDVSFSERATFKVGARGFWFLAGEG